MEDGPVETRADRYGPSDMSNLTGAFRDLHELYLNAWQLKQILILVVSLQETKIFSS